MIGRMLTEYLLALFLRFLGNYFEHYLKQKVQRYKTTIRDLKLSFVFEDRGRVWISGTSLRFNLR